jgi:uncharacterized protein (TIGR02145 family)
MATKVIAPSILFSFLIFMFLPSNGQDINLTFNGTGAASQIDSVIVTNQATRQRIILPGDATLTLSANTGIPSENACKNQGTVFPNPFSGRTTLKSIYNNGQTVNVKVQNLFGQVVAQTKTFVQPGENEFSLSLKTPGIYFISLSSELETEVYRVICTGETESVNRIQYSGIAPGSGKMPSFSGFKSSPVIYLMRYKLGDIIHFRCRSGIYTTILSDLPGVSKNYDVEFVPCSDPDGRNYSVVKIGDQTWMAENLAYLPAANPLSGGSETSPYNYVYDYEGSSVTEAKGTAEFRNYGVLYNWPAAMNGAASSTSVPSGVRGICPSGWHVPSDSEWTVLTDFLTSNGYGYIGSEAAISKSMASTSGWSYSPSSIGIGNSQWTNNRSGFNALPGGYRYYGGFFTGLGSYANFWSSSDSGLYSWWRYLYYDRYVVHRYCNKRSFGLSVRCLRD